MKKEIDIIYEDKNIVVVNKRSGISVISALGVRENQTLAGMLKKQLKQNVWVIHSINRDTTGVLVFAKNLQAYRDIRLQFENSKVCKKYIALVSGVLEEDKGTINKPILISVRNNVSADIVKGRASVTNFKILKRFRSYTLVQILLLTGRKDQIRVHFWSLGHPLAIDSEYGTSNPIILSDLKHGYKFKSGKLEKPLISRLSLHAVALTLTLPGSNEEKIFEVSLPKDFKITLKQLCKYGS